MAAIVVAAITAHSTRDAAWPAAACPPPHRWRQHVGFGMRGGAPGSGEAMTRARQSHRRATARPPHGGRRHGCRVAAAPARRNKGACATSTPEPDKKACTQISCHG